MNYNEAMSHLLGILGQPVSVYVAPSGAEWNVAILTGVLASGADFGAVGGPDNHEDFREGNTFFWVKDRYGYNGFLVGEDTFLSAEVDDDDSVSIKIEQSGGVEVLVVPRAAGDRALTMFD